MTSLAVIGAGRMGGALIAGWLESGTAATDLLILDPRPGEAAHAAIDAGASTDMERLREAEMVLLSVKPQIFPTLAGDLADKVSPDATLLSIMAGTSLATLRDAFPGRTVLRAMPNTPAAIGRGVTGLHIPGDLDPAVAERAESLLSVSGPVIRVDSEDMIDRITAISGSGPAYIFHMCEALEAAAHSQGFDAATSRTLARETLMGASALLAEGEATDLRTAVTSPNGTTQAALDVLMAELPDLMQRTAQAAYARAVELGAD